MAETRTGDKSGPRGKGESRLALTMLCAACLGGAAAWAATGVFAFGAFLVVAVLGLAVQVGLYRFWPHLPWILAPLLVVAVYWTQAGRLDWGAVWPALIALVIPAAARSGYRGYVAAYGILLAGVMLGGLPACCLLCVLPAPLAWRATSLADEAMHIEWMAATGLLLVSGYIIKGLIR